MHLSISFVSMLGLFVVNQNVPSLVAHCDSANSSMIYDAKTEPHYFCVKIFNYITDDEGEECKKYNGVRLLYTRSNPPSSRTMKMFAAQFYRQRRLSKDPYFCIAMNGDVCSRFDIKYFLILWEAISVNRRKNAFYACYIGKHANGFDRPCSLIFDAPKPCEAVEVNGRVKCVREFKFNRQIRAGEFVCQLPPEVKESKQGVCECSCTKDVVIGTSGEVCDCSKGEMAVPKVVYKQSKMCSIAAKFERDGICNKSCVIDGPVDLCLYGSWKNFSSTVKCRTSLITRSREQTRVNDNCKEPVLSESLSNSSYDDCDTCQIYYEGNWSACSKSCGFGKKTRKVKKFVKGQDIQDRCGNLTNGSDEFRDCPGLACPENCMHSEWTDWGDCNVPCNKGTKNRSRELLSSRAYNGTCEDNSIIAYENCSGKFRECQVNCHYSHFTEWSTCSRCRPKGADPLVKKRMRNIIAHATPFGEKCNLSSLKEQIQCPKQRECPIAGEMSDEDKVNITTAIVVLASIVLIVFVATGVVLVFIKHAKKRKEANQISNMLKKYEVRLKEKHSTKSQKPKSKSHSSSILLLGSKNAPESKKISPNTKFKSSLLSSNAYPLSSSKFKSLSSSPEKRSTPVYKNSSMKGSTTKRSSKKK